MTDGQTADPISAATLELLERRIGERVTEKARGQQPEIEGRVARLEALHETAGKSLDRVDQTLTSVAPQVRRLEKLIEQINDATKDIEEIETRLRQARSTDQAVEQSRADIAKVSNELKALAAQVSSVRRRPEIRRDLRPRLRPDLRRDYRSAERLVKLVTKVAKTRIPNETRTAADVFQVASEMGNAGGVGRFQVLTRSDDGATPCTRDPLIPTPAMASCAVVPSPEPMPCRPPKP